MINRIRQQNIMDNYGASSGNYEQSAAPSQQPMPEWRIPRAEFALPFPQPTQPSVDWVKRMNELYTPENEMMNYNNQFVQNFPERKSPSIGSRFAASMMGLGGAKVDDMNKVMHGKSDRAIEDWKTRSQPTYNAANLERQGNINERQLAGQIVTAEANDRRIGETERSNRAREDENNRKNEAREGIDRQKVEIARAKANGATFHTAGEYMIAKYPDGRTVNTGVKTTNFSPFELENLRQTGDIAQIRERGNQDRQTEDVRQNGRLEIHMTESPNKGRGNSNSPDTDTPNEARTRRNNTFQNIWDTRPDLRTFLKQPTSVNGNWSVGDPPTGGMWSSVSEKDKAAYQEVQRLVGGQSKPQSNNTQSTNTVPANAWVQKSPSTGARRYSIDGGKTWKPYPGGK